MDQKRHPTIILIFRLTKNIVSLTGTFSFFLVFFYVMGNFQGFQDSTQSLIISILGISSVFFGIVSFFGIIESIVFMFIKDLYTPLKKAIFLVVMVLCEFISVALVTMAIVLGVLTEGM